MLDLNRRGMMEAYRGTNLSLPDPFSSGTYPEGHCGCGTHKMNRVLRLVCGIILVMNAYALLAQFRGGHRSGTTRPPAGVATTDDLKAFNRAVALQASPDQVVQFRQLSDSTQVARKNAQDLLKVAQKPSKADVFRSANLLTSALETAQTDNQKFVRSFSPAQKSGLRQVTKKLDHANSDVTKRSKALTRDLEHSPIPRQYSGIAEKLDKALSDVQTRQLAIGKEMGIPSGTAPQ